MTDAPYAAPTQSRALKIALRWGLYLMLTAFLPSGICCPCS